MFWLPREGTPLGRASHPHHAHPHHTVLLGKRFQENSDYQTPGNPISPDLSRGLVDPKVWHCWGLRGVWYSSGLVLLGSHGTHVGQYQAHPRPPPRITTAPPQHQVNSHSTRHLLRFSRTRVGPTHGPGFRHTWDQARPCRGRAGPARPRLSGPGTNPRHTSCCSTGLPRSLPRCGAAPLVARRRLPFRSTCYPRTPSPPCI